MAATPRRMHLVGYLIAGPTWHHHGSWRQDASDAVDALDPARYEHLAKVMEAAKFDGLFFVDTLMLTEFYQGSHAEVVRNGGQIYMLEPMQLLAAMARVTSRIGLSATMSTAFAHPFQIARAFATLDHISKGRAAWNIVTSTTTREAQNFGLASLPSPTERYDHADEVVEACCRLWECWEADAIVYDRERGIYADPAKVHRADYEGRWVRTRGPLPTPRSPQGRPVFMQAGSSDRGRDFAARWAEVVFTLQHSKQDMQRFCADMKSRVAAAGRRPEQCAVLPAIDVILGETQEIARERADYIASLVNPEFGIAEISNALGVDLPPDAFDRPVDELSLKEGARGMLDVILQASKPGTPLTIREAARRYGNTRMNPQIVGTPKMVADYMQDLFESGCCDGFVLCPAVSPEGYVQFCRSVVPELQRRGIFRKDYAGRTFRENLAN
ncbi:MAG: LLM class flavin-dependent oxidoreductase [Proteobacteria bacterium]|nr:LLM class flavin-dependent oxidoreductase [Pseudomonadota bacterium]